MKVLGWILGFLVVILGGVYFMLFTSGGNAIVKPFVEEKIREATKLDS